MGWWSAAMRTRSTQWTYRTLPRDGTSAPVEPETSYLSVFLRTAHVVDVRRGLRRFHAAVNSSVSLPARSGSNAQFIATLAPTTLQDVAPASAAPADRFIQVNRRLAGPVPYIGGDVEAEVGLFSVPSSELAGPYLKLLESLSKTPALAFMGVSLALVEPVRQGIQLLAGDAEGTGLEIGFATLWRPLQTGWVIAARVPQDGRGFRVDPDEGRLLDESGGPVGDYPYLLLEVCAEPTRDDWYLIPEIADSYGELQREIRRGRQDDVEEALAVFRRTALTCGDLLFDDALRLCDQVRERIAEIGLAGPGVRSSGSHNPVPDLRDFSPFAI
ncbi:hypothetical protein ACFQ6E_38145 [Streptomyces sp. NPDC056462]|uniref:hypothetical protein n=1 Tax=Streptomyces sp. NPDC056462 TaxID=3345826 RepID=UPI00369E6A34